mmetsp:Transcript_19474/g.2647  ORF Transcript_19474/g.2647 Transcript_19474/m.2647 type:complete len:129 (+) Transcript_19474:127-513(+)
MLKGFPCKVVDYSTSKAGKHGHAKATILGKDIFTGKSHEDFCPTSHNIDIPFVKKAEYLITDIDGDQLNLMDDDCEAKDDLNFPSECDDDLQLTKEVRDRWADESHGDLFINVLMAMGRDKIIGWREK